MAFENLTMKNYLEQEAELLKLILESEGIAGSVATIPPRGTISKSPLSYAQERLWFLNRLEPNGDAYNVPLAFELTGELNRHVLERSLQEIIRRHEVLRTRFVMEAGRPVQEILETPQVHLPFMDLRSFDADEARKRAKQIATEEGRRSFDLSKGELLHAVLMRLEDERHWLAFTIHHIVFDEWSLKIFKEELRAIYDAFRAGKPSPLPGLPIQYADFAVWQRKWLKGEVLEKQLEYWKKQLSPLPEQLELPTDHPRPLAQSYRGAVTSRVLDWELWDRCRAISRSENASMFILLLAVFEAVIARYTGQKDFAVGCPVANRDRVETEELIGFFLNTLVMRANLSKESTFKQLLEQVRESALKGFAHQDVPFEKVVEVSAPDRDLSRSPMFQVMFTLQDSQLPKPQTGSLGLRLMPVEITTSKCDLILMVAVEEQGPTLRLNYSTDLFEEKTIQRMGEHWKRMLEAMVEEGGMEAKVWEVEMLSEEERRQVVEEWNQTEREYEREKSLGELFEAEVERRGG
ncbi:MAG TPA: condensation domain-containing protein, partial [Candidatus Angelobacter sp.]